jgi:hypothetical protein
MKSFVLENTRLIRGMSEFGWGNGYVLIPKGHPLWGKDYDLIDMDVDVHGGITFGEEVTDELIERLEPLTDQDKGFWMIGFDTAHYRDNLASCPKEYVEAETKRLAEQIENYK